MNPRWYAKVTLLIGLCVLSAYLLYPSYYFYFRATEEQRDSTVKFCQALPRWAHCAKLNLGLDLQGGVHLVMGVRVDKVLQHRADRLAESLKDALQSKNLKAEKLDRPHDNAHIVLTLAQETSADDVEKLLHRDFAVLNTIRREGQQLTLALDKKEVDNVRDTALEQSIKTIRNRADKLGVTEPTIARRGNDQVLIQLPGVKDPQHAIDIIGRTAQLEFTLVDGAATAAFEQVLESDLPQGVLRRQKGLGKPDAKQSNAAESYFELPEQNKADVAKLLEPHLPEGRVLAFGVAQTANGLERPGFLRTYVLHSRPGITGDYLLNAQVQQNQELPSDYFVTMTFDPAGAKIFEKLTSDSIGQMMAIVLDGTVTSAPVIQEKIAGGTARITLGRSVNAQAKFQEAKDLALVLKAGALPAPVEVREKRQVGKTLGQDTVAKGTTAMLVGAALVVVFMALYYRLSGLIANVALVLNVVFMMAVLSLLEATLTLPGMAGIVLTIGMAVDANVLIFERILEELRLGQSVRLAIDAGYKKAFATIFDSNITTLIAGVVLMQYGSGPVRGFAVTLIVGLTCSLYTAVVVTRLLYDLLMGRGKRLVSLSI